MERSYRGLPWRKTAVTDSQLFLGGELNPEEPHILGPIRCQVLDVKCEVSDARCQVEKSTN